MSFNVGFIGGGNMSTVIFKGIVKKDAHPASKIWVSGPHIENLQHWSDMGAHITTKNEEVIRNCDLVFLGVKPGMLQDVLKYAGDALYQRIVENPDFLIVSMLAGISLDSLKKAICALKPDMIHQNEHIKIVRIMPNVPMAVGAGICLYSCSNQAKHNGNLTLEMVKVLQSCGSCEEVSESLMDNLGVLTGCGPAYIFIIIEALADGAVKQGVPREAALRNAALMVMGSASVVLNSKKHPAQLKDEVCSPGGSTICGVSVLEEGKIRSTLINAIEASTNRTKKLDPKSADHQ